MYPLEIETSAANSRCAVAISLGETPLRVSDNICDLVNSLQERFNDIVFLICDDIHKYEMMIPKKMTIGKAQRAATIKGDELEAILHDTINQLGDDKQLSATIAILRWSDIEDEDYHKLLDIMYKYRGSFEKDLRSSSEFYIKRRLAVATLTEKRIESFMRYTLAELPIQIMGLNYNNCQYTTILHPVYPRKNADGSTGTVINSEYVSPIENVVQAYRNNSDVVGDICYAVPHMNYGTVTRVFFERAL
ncbi:hypothetical protein BFJ72_g12641 [Fusarium proliferatum]|uniref:Cyclodipeptide synthase n=1 Tax=Gibberella intermedia TaxID=948311 RepID=A0A420SFX5_GIBIN|nr:hypothetical protein BFJ72_g12641 [Fusarium proliferatum]